MHRPSQFHKCFNVEERALWFADKDDKPGRERRGCEGPSVLINNCDTVLGLLIWVPASFQVYKWQIRPNAIMGEVGDFLYDFWSWGITLMPEGACGTLRKHLPWRIHSYQMPSLLVFWMWASLQTVNFSFINVWCAFVVAVGIEPVWIRILETPICASTSLHQLRNNFYSSEFQ